MKYVITAAAAMAFAAPSLARDREEAPPRVEITSMVYAGSGCPAGTVAENLASDFSAFTLLFDSYVAEAAPGVPRRENRKNCQLNIELDYPDGWTFALLDVDYRGYVFLDRRVTATQKSSFYFQGSPHTGSLQTDMQGPLDEDYMIRDTIPVDQLVWAPCGLKRSLNINTQVRINNMRNRRGVGLITVDSLDGQLIQVYGLAWKRCGGHGGQGGGDSFDVHGF